MIHPNEKIVDNFAGGGGASIGIWMALGRHPDHAINHDEQAVELHRANHPTTMHHCQSVWKADPQEIAAGSPVGLAWFSPDCKHFSKAKGGKPVEKNIRDLAWVVVLWAQRVKPRVIFLENVEEFKDWGPLIRAEDGKLRPCPVQKGIEFKRWVRELKKAGYRVEHRELRACDYGAPTIRKRLFVIARSDGQSIVWPEPTHGAPHNPDVISGKLKPWRTAAEIIDWSLPCASIFMEPAEARRLGLKRPLAPATMARIARGVKRYVIDAARPFIVPVTHQGDLRIHSIDEPHRTTTTAKRGEHALVSPTLVGVGGRAGQSRPRGADEPTATSTSKYDTALVSAALVHTAHGERDAKGRKRGKGELPVVEPLPTTTASQDVAITAAHLLRTDMASAADRNGIHAPAEPTRTQTTSNSFAVAATTLIQTGYGERQGQQPRAPGLDKPLGTPVAGGVKHAAVAAFLAQHNAGPNNGGIAGHAADTPVSTLQASGSQQQIVAAHMTQLRGSKKDGRPAEQPASAVMAGGNHEAVVETRLAAPTWPGRAREVAAFLAEYYGTGGQFCDPKAPLNTSSTRDRFALVTVDGQEYVIADIGMRMLTPRELYRAQGFPADYKIEIQFKGRPLPKDAQVRMCGNSVCPDVAAALVRANFATPMQSTQAGAAE